MIGTVTFEADEALLARMRALGFDPASIARRAFREEAMRMMKEHSG